MAIPLDDRELRRRAIGGLRAECAAFATGAPDASLIERRGVLASLSPLTPDRSLFNAVYYEATPALEAVIDDLANTYTEAGVRAWTVWVPDDDRAAAALLEGRGHACDAAPRAMAMALDELVEEPASPAGIERKSCDPPLAAALNDRAYGYTADAFTAAFAHTSKPPIEWSIAVRDGEPICCVGVIRIDDDVCITGVATPPEHRGGGVASHLLWSVLADARESGMRSTSLQASEAGSPVYARLGFRDLGYVEMWEQRAPAPA